MVEEEAAREDMVFGSGVKDREPCRVGGMSLIVAKPD